MAGHRRVRTSSDLCRFFGTDSKTDLQQAIRSDQRSRDVDERHLEADSTIRNANASRRVFQITCRTTTHTFNASRARRIFEMRCNARTASTRPSMSPPTILGESVFGCPELWRLFYESGLFVDFVVHHGMENVEDRIVARYQPGALAEFDIGGIPARQASGSQSAPATDGLCEKTLEVTRPSLGDKRR